MTLKLKKKNTTENKYGPVKHTFYTAIISTEQNLTYFIYRWPTLMATGGNNIS